METIFKIHRISLFIAPAGLRGVSEFTENGALSALLLGNVACLRVILGNVKVVFRSHGT